VTKKKKKTPHSKMIGIGDHYPCRRDRIRRSEDEESLCVQKGSHTTKAEPTDRPVSVFFGGRSVSERMESY
ncbi:hypothetical protein RUM43_002069, partial [Polyplax serrata]